jgi:hypothetical protein
LLLLYLFGFFVRLGLGLGLVISCVCLLGQKVSRKCRITLLSTYIGVSVFSISSRCTRVDLFGGTNQPAIQGNAILGRVGKSFSKRLQTERLNGEKDACHDLRCIYHYHSSTPTHQARSRPRARSRHLQHREPCPRADPSRQPAGRRAFLWAA